MPAGGGRRIVLRRRGICLGSRKPAILSFLRGWTAAERRRCEYPTSVCQGRGQDAQLVEGRRGRGLEVTPKLCLQYATRESFAPKEGTIAFWMKPVGWGGHWQYRYFLNAQSDAVALNFYIYYGNPWFYVAGPKHYVLIGGNSATAFENGKIFPEGKWTFLAATYKPGQQASYINGKLDNRATDGLIEPEFVKKGVVEIPPGDQVLDEIMIFDRALTEVEIRAVYCANMP